MPVELNLFPEDYTLIVCKKPDGSSIDIDVLDIEEMSHSLFESPEETLPYAEYISKMCGLFAQKYNFPISRTSMSALIRTKDEILERLKKSIPTQPESVSSTQSSQEPTENL